jgi:uncharacterized membrane protein
MTDIYRQELAIPEKRKMVGWMLLFGGGVMVIIAVVLFFQEASLLKKFSVRPWEQPQVQDVKAIDQNGNTRQQLLNRTQPLFWIIAISLGLFVAFILVASLNHRLAGHVKNSLERKKSKTILGDPWKEAGEKFKLDESDQQ